MASTDSCEVLVNPRYWQGVPLQAMADKRRLTLRDIYRFVLELYPTRATCSFHHMSLHHVSLCHKSKYLSIVTKRDAYVYFRHLENYLLGAGVASAERCASFDSVAHHRFGPHIHPVDGPFLFPRGILRCT